MDALLIAVLGFFAFCILVWFAAAIVYICSEEKDAQKKPIATDLKIKGTFK